MRRRFAFVELISERSAVDKALDGWVATQRLQDDRADLLRRLNLVVGTL